MPFMCSLNTINKKPRGLDDPLDVRMGSIPNGTSGFEADKGLNKLRKTLRVPPSIVRKGIPLHAHTPPDRLTLM